MNQIYTHEEYIKLIDDALVYQAAHETPLEHSPKLSEKLGRQIFLKREDQQPVFSFKIRGAANKIFSLSPEELKSGVICSSAGNHAQGVAMAAKAREIPAHIVMPASAPTIKVQAVEKLGAKVTLYGDHYDQAQSKAYEIAEAENLCFIHPFNDHHVIAGQGTIAKEIVKQIKSIGAFFVPIGGGGMAAGTAMYLKFHHPEIKIIGIEPIDAASMKEAFLNNKPTEIDHVGIFADGVAVKKVGDETFRICKQFVDKLITVTTDQTCAAIQEIFEDTRTIVEPAGALSVAGIKKYFEENPDSKLGTDKTPIIGITCGANMNFERLRHISERAAIGKGKEALLSVKIPEKPGSFLEFTKTLGPRAITEFNYRASNNENATIFVGIEDDGTQDTRQGLISELQNSSYKVTDLTDNELAKLHMRYLAAGSGDIHSNERLYRFQFPERKGALRDFLEHIGYKWNITLFHYRNHGSDWGRVLVGIQVPRETKDEFEQHLNKLEYRFWDETDNEAYKLFLK